MLRVNVKLRARFKFYVYARSRSIHCLYFIYAHKTYVHTLVKITRQWKSTLQNTDGFMGKNTFKIQCINLSQHSFVGSLSIDYE